MVLLAVRHFVSARTRGKITVVGDALGVWHGLAKFPAKSPSINEVAKELAMYLAPLGHEICGIHVWSEANVLADALSRLSQGGRVPQILTHARREDIAPRGPEAWMCLGRSDTFAQWQAWASMGHGVSRVCAMCQWACVRTAAHCVRCSRPGRRTPGWVLLVARGSPHGRRRGSARSRGGCLANIARSGRRVHVGAGGCASRPLSHPWPSPPPIRAQPGFCARVGGGGCAGRHPAQRGQGARVARRRVAGLCPGSQAAADNGYLSERHP